MPSISINDVLQMTSVKPTLFVETGTFQGETLNNMIPHFKRLVSIELNHSFAESCKTKFSTYKNVTIVEGDSSKELESICKELDEPTFFWLDGHWSGGNTGRGDKDCPLLEEIEVIVKHCKEMCVIAIDDVRLFGSRMNEDWSSITRERVVDIVSSRLSSISYYPSNLHPQDRMVLTLFPICKA